MLTLFVFKATIEELAQDYDFLNRHHPEEEKHQAGTLYRTLVQRRAFLA